MFPQAIIGQAIATASWPARFQRLPDGALTQDREIWIDGAHNPTAAKALAEELAKRPMHVVIGILANKDADGIVASLAHHALSLTFVAVPDHDSHDPVALAERWGGRRAASLGEAIGDTPVLIVGSLYLCGEALRLNGTLPT